MHGWMDGWPAGWLGGWLAGCMDGWMDGWTDGRTDGRMGGWVEGRKEGWMDVKHSQACTCAHCTCMSTQTSKRLNMQQRTSASLHVQTYLLTCRSITSMCASVSIHTVDGINPALPYLPYPRLWEFWHLPYYGQCKIFYHQPNVHTWVCMRMYVYIFYTYVHIYICMYVCMCIYIYNYIHVFVYIASCDN